MSKKARFKVKYLDEKNILRIECTPNIEESVMETFSRLFPIQVIQSSKFIADVKNDEGKIFKRSVVYEIPITKDLTKIFFDAAFLHLSESIQQSIPNNDN